MRHYLNIKTTLASAGLFFALVSGSSTPAADFPQGLMLHLNFDPWEANGLITDRTGRSNNGKAFGAKWTSTGKLGAGYEFTTTNNYIQVTNAPSLNAKQATFALWFKTSKQDSIRRYLIEKIPSNGYALNIAGEPKNTGKLCAEVNGHSCLSDNVVTDNAWHHGTATFDGENLKLYVDGQLQKQITPWHGEITANTNDLIIGMNRSNPLPQEKGQSFEGAIDDVMYFNHALSDAEVKVVFESVKPKFTQAQVDQRLKELKELYDRGLLKKDFYDRKVKECEVTP